jgi:hypothetical protein
MIFFFITIIFANLPKYQSGFYAIQKSNTNQSMLSLGFSIQRKNLSMSAEVKCISQWANVRIQFYEEPDQTFLFSPWYSTLA